MERHIARMSGERPAALHAPHKIVAAWAIYSTLLAVTPNPRSSIRDILVHRKVDLSAWKGYDRIQQV
eukprot:2831819-Pleurochrysis_carterae.AAC.4